MVWTDITLEGYCFCRNKKQCPKKYGAAERLTPEYWCLTNNCVHFSYCDATIAAYRHMNKFYMLDKTRRRKK